MAMTAATPESVAAQIRPALTQLYVMYFRMAEQSDLTGPQLTIMTRLNNLGAARISEIARLEGIRMPTDWSSVAWSNAFGTLKTAEAFV